VIPEPGVAYGGGTLGLANLRDLLRNSSAQLIGIKSNLKRATDLWHPRIKLTEGNCLDCATES